MNYIESCQEMWRLSSRKKGMKTYGETRSYLMIVASISADFSIIFYVILSYIMLFVLILYKIVKYFLNPSFL